MPQRLVLVSGPPASGKTTLAVPLARELGFPLLAKDHIKEVLHDSLGRGRDRDAAWSGLLGGAAFDLMWSLAAAFPAAVLEANFSARAGQRLRDRPDVATVEVFCACPPRIAAQRYARRWPTTHPVHVTPELTAESLGEYRPLGVGPLVVVDTTRPTDVGSLASKVLTAFG